MPHAGDEKRGSRGIGRLRVLLLKCAGPSLGPESPTASKSLRTENQKGHSASSPTGDGHFNAALSQVYSGRSINVSIISHNDRAWRKKRRGKPTKNTTHGAISVLLS